MTTTIDATAIDRFAREVRLALKDLGSAEVNELTDGLEADLAAQAEEQGDAFSLADPVAYAAELRDAAGFSESSSGLFTTIERFASSIRESIEQSRVLRGISRFFGSLAPVWWVARAFVAFALFQIFISRESWPLAPTNPGTGLILIAFVAVSVQLGRRVWKLNRFWTLTVGALNIFAILVAPGVALVVGNIAQESLNLYVNGAQLPVNESGLKMNSGQIDNILVFDENGKPLHDVQLFDQDGNPISVGFNINDFPSVVVNDEFLDAQYVQNPRAGYGAGWNVFPLKIESFNEDGTSSIVDAPLPFETAPKLLPAATTSK